MEEVGEATEDPSIIINDKHGTSLIGSRSLTKVDWTASLFTVETGAVIIRVSLRLDNASEGSKASRSAVWVLVNRGDFTCHQHTLQRDMDE